MTNYNQYKLSETLWKKVIEAQKQKNSLQIYNHNEDIFGQFDTGAFDLQFSFDDLQGSSLTESSQHMQVMYHELYHLYQTLSQPVVTQLNALSRYETGVMSYIHHLYVGENKKIDLAQFNSILEIKDHVKIAPVLEQEFAKWAIEYSEFSKYLHKDIGGFSVHQLIECAAYLTQTIITHDFPKVTFPMPDYYLVPHRKFVTKYGTQYTEYELMILHLIIINFSLSYSINLTSDIYHFLVSRVSKILDGTDGEPNLDEAFLVVDLYIMAYYQHIERKPDEFIRNVFTTSDPEFDQNYNKFLYNMFGSIRGEGNVIPDDLMEQAGKLKKIERLIGFEYSEYAENKKYLILIQNIESALYKKFGLTRTDRYSAILKNESRTNNLTSATVVKSNPMFMHPFFILKVITNRDTTNDLMTAYKDVWTKLSGRVKNLVHEDDLYNVDYTVQMRPILNLNRILSGQKARCCDTHKWQHLGQITKCTELGSLKWQLETLYGKNIEQIFV